MDNDKTMKRIHAAFMGMPYGVGCLSRKPYKELTLNDIAQALENLQENLRSASNNSENTKKELHDIKTELHAVSNLFSRIM